MVGKAVPFRRFFEEDMQPFACYYPDEEVRDVV